jgi:hypothetical protein
VCLRSVYRLLGFCWQLVRAPAVFAAGGAQLASAPLRNLTPPPGAAAPAYPRPAAGELVIVDVNYFPSFNGIPEAPEALQAALWERYQAAQQQQ